MTGSHVVAADAVWTWFHDPRAVHRDGRVVVGFSSNTGIWVGLYDVASGGWTATHLGDIAQVDDHAVPAVRIRPDGRIVAVWSEMHGPLLCRVSTDPGSVDSWGPAVTVDAGQYTYPNLVWLEAEQRFHLFARRMPQLGSRVHDVFTSPDGESWSARSELLPADARPYLKVSASGGRIDCVFTDDHPFTGGPVGLRHCFYDGTWRTSSGLPLSGPPLDLADMTVVHDSAQGNCWIWDVAPGPTVVYATFNSPQDHRYRYARWDGTAWQTSEITAAGPNIYETDGEPYYSGGVVLDHGDPSRVYLSRKVGRTWEVESWQTGDGGESWTAHAVTYGTAPPVKNIRPVVPRGGGSVMWLHGTYDTFRLFGTGLAVSA